VASATSVVAVEDNAAAAAAAAAGGGAAVRIDGQVREVEEEDRWKSPWFRTAGAILLLRDALYSFEMVPPQDQEPGKWVRDGQDWAILIVEDAYRCCWVSAMLSGCSKDGAAECVLGLESLWLANRRSCAGGPSEGFVSAVVSLGKVRQVACKPPKPNGLAV
jgi:hypothetical protein